MVSTHRRFRKYGSLKIDKTITIGFKHEQFVVDQLSKPVEITPGTYK
jgi:hypothetical protein